MLDTSYTIRKTFENERANNLRVINKIINTTPTTIFLGKHDNLIIISFDVDLLLCDQTFSVTNINEQLFVDAGMAIELRGHRQEYITLAAATASTRVRIIVW